MVHHPPGHGREPARLPVEREPIRPRDASERGRYVYLLDLDEELADLFEMRMRIAVRPVVTARMRQIPRGEFDLAPLFEWVKRGLGLLLVHGVVELDTRVGDRTASELLGAGDLLVAESDDHPLLPHQTQSVALTSTRIVGLDDSFVQRIKPWPQITHALIRREARRAMDLNVQRAATSHPRADVRVALLLWHLAQRWGKVQPDGILLPLPLTHRLIGRLVGAERPSVSHALSHLSSENLVERCEGGLLLRGTAEHHLACLIQHGGRRQEAGA